MKKTELGVFHSWTIVEYHLLLHYVGFEVMCDSLCKFLCILSIPPSHLHRK